jgi:hypothetical protein
MATLAATAAPKLSEMSEGAKSEKSMNEIDKILTRLVISRYKASKYFCFDIYNI